MIRVPSNVNPPDQWLQRTGLPMRFAGRTPPPVDGPGGGNNRPEGPREPSVAALVLLGVTGVLVAIAYYWLNPATMVILLGTVACVGLWRMSRHRTPVPDRSFVSQPILPIIENRFAQLLTADEQAVWLRGAVAMSLERLFEQAASPQSKPTPAKIAAEPARQSAGPAPESLPCADLTKIYLA